MTETAEPSPELTARLEQHCAEGESIEELLNHYESEGNLPWEGYGGEP